MNIVMPGPRYWSMSARATGPIGVVLEVEFVALVASAEVDINLVGSAVVRPTGGVEAVECLFRRDDDVVRLYRHNGWIGNYSEKGLTRRRSDSYIERASRRIGSISPCPAAGY